MDRYGIINYYGKNEFSNFLSGDTNGKVLELFNDEGIEIMKKCPLKEERICYILTFSPYKNELFKNAKFLDMFLASDISRYYAVLGHLNFDTYNYIFNRAMELNHDGVVRLFNYFNEDYKLKLLDKWPYSNELLHSILASGSPRVVKKILDNYDIDLTKINIRNFFEFLNNSVLSDWSAKNNSELFNIVDIQVPPRMMNKNYLIKCGETMIYIQ